MNFVLRTLFFVLNILYVFAFPLIWLKSRTFGGKKQPRILDPLLKIPASDLAAKIRKREISSLRVCEAYINRIKEVNPILNAVVEVRFESALQEARNIDQYLQNSSVDVEELERTKPLLGIPLTVKESCSVAGLSLCGGTLARIGVKSDKDGEVVKKLKESGAIPILVTNTPEICLAWESNNFVTGRTNNPYDVTRSSSGSSGGEGALLGAAASLIGIGSDIAGSIRLPAMFNGVFGHKPTPRIISISGHYPFVSDPNYADYLVIGPMARYAKDLRLMTQIMVDDSIAAHLRINERVNLGKVRVFHMTEESKSVFTPRVQPEIKAVIRESVEYLKTRCSEIVDFRFESLRDGPEIGGSVLYSLNDIPNLLKGENHNLGLEMIKSLVGLSSYTFNLLTFYAIQSLYNMLICSEDYTKENNELRRLFIEKLGDDGVFLYPTFTTSAFRHNAFLFHSSAVSYLMIFNTLGLPATHVPCGFDKDGLPIGLQVVAAPNQDRLCLAVAEELEKCFGGWKQNS